MRIYISKKKRDAMYAAIRKPVVDARIDLQLSPNNDVRLAQIEHEIWGRIKIALGMK